MFNSENYISLDSFCRLAAHLYPSASEGLKDSLI
jgi:hypothetical protein